VAKVGTKVGSVSGLDDLQGKADALRALDAQCTRPYAVMRRGAAGGVRMSGCVH
jgi:hypothetical protein